ncbi:ABC transporter ATP-binding protein [Rubellimicrobium roseum]|uniref:sn-glycerol-3-phosphate ABC transporter ATP-binding protein UgpC n=1 Tax=Rubellimicrobium roseum TaxID=687525 RepID=A0A5C4NE94_9RHOB|nr:sn-glycerol-3-phosphate ABC transporter ATP-binding protein UgpC [Rubellimicrobium roseum]TNC72220.1 sn-glycerol-3-phosphate ABC transporter ATP-binding protein UgpC [Rubellimicrobium roseum]
MARVTLRDVRKAFDGQEVVRGISAEIGDGEFVVLVGPSGCGKSTLLRMIAGLEEITAGTVAIDGAVVNDVPPKDRDIAMVFQNYALYPHMTVAENMGFSLRLRGVDKRSIEAAVARAAAALEVAHLLDRTPRQLSGGQRQRVAMGRAIVRNPRLFLFDEPLSNLDAKLRVQMRTELRELHARLGVTSIYVTHDQIEAMTMADRILVLRDGRVEQQGRPLDLYDRPVNTFVAGFLGSPAMNLLDVVPGPDGVALADGTPLGFAPRGGPARLTLGVRPEHLRLLPADAPQGLPARLRSVEPTGSETLLVAQMGERPVTVLARERVTARAGDAVRLLPDPGQAHWFDGEGQRIEAA